MQKLSTGQKIAQMYTDTIRKDGLWKKVFKMKQS